MRKKVFSFSMIRSKASVKPSLRAYLAPFSPSNENCLMFVASCFNPSPILVQKGEVQPNMRQKRESTYTLICWLWRYR